MKKIKIFLASSITDLYDDRLAIGDFFRQLNEIYIDLGVHFSLIKCEDYDNSIALSGKQSQYDGEIRDSELCFFLFFRKIGEYTLHEFDVALEAFKKNGRPKIVTYVKYIDDIQNAPEEVVAFMKRLDGEMRHYYNTYGHIDTLKLGVLMQIKLLGLDVSKENDVSVKDGKVVFMGESLLSTENIPIFSGNEGLAQLTERKKQITAELNEARSKYLADPVAENEERFLSVSSKYNSVSKELSTVESEMLALVSAVAELTADGRVLTHRQKEALKLFNSGDYSGAQNILDGEEREAELKLAEARHENAKNELRGYVEENLLWIKAQRARGIDKVADLKIRDKFERAIDIIKRYDLERAAEIAYMEYLYAQNEYKAAIKIAEELLRYYNTRFDDPDKNQLSILYNTLGLCYDTVGDPAKADEYYSKAIKICINEGKIVGDDMHSAVANTLNNRGRLCLVQKQYEKSEKNFKSSEAIYNYLSNKYPKHYDASVSLLFGNIGGLYIELGRYDEAESYLNRALDLHQKARSHGYGLIEALESEIVIAYINMAHLYACRGDYLTSVKNYDIAEEMINALSLKDPEAFRAKLSMVYANKTGVLIKLLRFEEAEECAKRAISSIELLAEKNEVFKANLAIAYNNIGVMYMNTGRHQESLEYLEKSIEEYTKVYKNSRKVLLAIVTKINLNVASVLFHMGEYSLVCQKSKENIDLLTELCDTEYDAYAPYLGHAYTTYCTALSQIELYDEAAEHGRRAVDILEKEVRRNPSASSESLSLAYASLGGVYADKGDYGDALDCYLKSLAIVEEIARTQPITVIDRLAQIYYNISIVYSLAEDCDSQEKYLLLAEEEYRKYYELLPEVALDDYLTVSRGVCEFYIESGEFDTARERLIPYSDFVNAINEQYDGAYIEWVKDAEELLGSVTFE